LQLPALPERRQLTQGNRPPVSKLARPMTKLMPAIAGSIGTHGGSQPVAGEDFNRGLRRARQPEQRGAVIRPRQQAWRRNRSRRYPRIGGSSDLSDEIPALGVGR